ncbi:MAG TPA: ABC transporter permease [Gemmatimonadaceae bacterium]|nr:ABC transporter permease [Gemmatimonadaceae bacterium]
MSISRQLKRGLRALTRRRAADQDVADEVEHYLEQTTAAHVARGLSPEQARRAAQLEIGHATVVREQVRAYGWENAIDGSVADLRYAARRLRRNPGFTAVSVLTLALGIGASTAIFSAVNPILFEPLPYPHADRLVTVWDHGSDDAPLAITFGSYRELAARTRSFEGLAVASPWQPTLSTDARPERLDGQRVSASYFHTLGVLPAIGRDFDAADDRPNGPSTVILSEALWRGRFGGDSTIVGRAITLDDARYTVVGVMPRGFESVPGSSADAWTLLQYASSLPSEGPEWGHNLRMIGRLRPTVSIDQGMRDFDAVARNPVPEFARPPWAALRKPLSVTSLQTDVTRGVRPALLAVMGAVLLLLVIACVNVTNLLLARGAQRRGELAMRAALGAERTRLVRQLLTETLVIAAVGGALGVLVAGLGVRALVALAPPELPRLAAVGVNGATLAFALVASTIVGLSIGLAPALQATRSDLRAALSTGSRRAAGSHYASRGTVVVAEVALALVLMVSTGLLLRSLERLFAIDPGFTPSHILTMRLEATGRAYENDSVTYLYFQNALDAVRRVPGVTSAAFTSQLPLSGDGDTYGAHFESSPTGRNESAVFRYAVTPGYFETMGIALVRGRSLATSDRAGAPYALVINESFARRKFPGRNPLGQRLHLGPDRGPWYTIVGVVRDVKQLSLAVSQADAAYIPTDQSWFADRVLSLVARTRGDSRALAPAIENAIWAVDKNQPIVRVATMDDVVATSAAQRRFALVAFEAFALAALALAAVGIYGVLSGSVAERVREIGVRLALGASPRDVVRLVMRQGMALAVTGVVLGLLGAAAASRALITLLFGISRLDPATYFNVVGLLLGVAAVACGVPAWRAARVDPSVTLRAE